MQAGFKALLLCLAGASGVIRRAATSRAALEIPGSAPVVFVLHNDQTVGETQPPPCPGVMCVTSSGVLLAPADSLPPWLHLGARKRAMIEYMETVAQYAHSESWDLFYQQSDGSVRGWPYGFGWQDAVCLTTVLHLYDRAVTCLWAAAGLGVATLAPPELVTEPTDARCTRLVVVGTDAAPAPDGVVTPRVYTARAEPPGGHMQVRLGDKFWVVAPEASLPTHLVHSMPSLAEVVPRSAAIVRDHRPRPTAADTSTTPRP